MILTTALSSEKLRNPEAVQIFALSQIARDPAIRSCGFLPSSVSQVFARFFVESDPILVHDTRLCKP
jgi:hypothetical protein